MSTTPATPKSVDFGGLVLEYTPSDTENKVFVSVTFNGAPVASQNLTPFNTMLSWKDASTNAGTTTGNFFVLFGSASNVSALWTNGISWTSVNQAEQHVNLTQIATW